MREGHKTAHGEKSLPSLGPCTVTVSGDVVSKEKLRGWQTEKQLEDLYVHRDQDQQPEKSSFGFKVCWKARVELSE